MEESRLTCRKVFIDWPVVHLQSGIPSVPGETHQMVFAVVDRGRCLLHADVHRPNVECNTYFSLFLKKREASVTHSSELDTTTQADLILSSPLKFVVQ